MALIQEEPAFANIPFTSIPGMEYVKVFQPRNDALRKLDSAFVQNQFKTYKPQLISDMWKYAQSGGFVVM